jgi:hypothetical protein
MLRFVEHRVATQWAISDGRPYRDSCSASEIG